MSIPESMAELVRDLDDTQAYVKDAVTERTDSSTFDELVAMGEAVEKVKKACDEALSLIRTEQLRQLEEAGSRMVGHRVYARVPDKKTRFNHKLIAQRVRELAKELAVDKETGVVDTDRLTEEVARILLSLYTAPATKAKTTVLDELDIPIREVAQSKITGHKIQIVELKADDEL